MHLASIVVTENVNIHGSEDSNITNAFLFFRGKLELHRIGSELPLKPFVLANCMLPFSVKSDGCRGLSAH